MNRLARLISRVRVNALAVSAALMTAVLLHLGAVLSVADLGRHRGMLAMNSFGSVNVMAVMPPGGALLPFDAQDERIAICRYDLRHGPVTITAKLGSDAWTLALYSPGGSNFYAISGAELERRDVELILAPTDQSLGTPLPLGADISATAISIGVQQRTGLAIIRAPLPGPAFADDWERLLTLATCQPRAQPHSSRDSTDG
jgi:uncharacterized membrane protein